MMTSRGVGRSGGSRCGCSRRRGGGGRGWMCRRGGVAGAGSGAIAEGRGQVLRLPAPEGGTFLIGVVCPVITNLVPKMAQQIVGIIFHKRYLLEDRNDIFSLLFSNAIYGEGENVSISINLGTSILRIAITITLLFHLPLLILVISSGFL